MAKLKCDAHKRRVFAIGGKFVHRSDIGDETFGKCDSKTASINEKSYDAKSERFNAA